MKLSLYSDQFRKKASEEKTASVTSLAMADSVLHREHKEETKQEFEVRDQSLCPCLVCVKNPFLQH